ncbi:MAG: GrpB family protein [Asgard group archaeon]|nr:GrpB family protein [Asgard group archaeon]
MVLLVLDHLKVAIHVSTIYICGKELFRKVTEPIIIEKYNADWIAKYEKTKNKLLEIIDEFVVAIEHIGSTAIPGLASKPVIDILIGLRSLEDAEKCISKLIEHEYEYVQEHEKVLPNRRFFRKPAKGLGKREYHVHMVEINSYFWKRQLLFRDYIKSHPDALREYEALKYSLALKFKENRQAYVDGKDEFIEKILKKAQKQLNKK